MDEPLINPLLLNWITMYFPYGTSIHHNSTADWTWTSPTNLLRNYFYFYFFFVRSCARFVLVLVFVFVFVCVCVCVRVRVMQQKRWGDTKRDELSLRRVLALPIASSTGTVASNLASTWLCFPVLLDKYFNTNFVHSVFPAPDSPLQWSVTKLQHLANTERVQRGPLT